MDIADRVLQLLESQAAATEYVLGQVELGGLQEVCALLGKDKATIGHWVAGRRSPDPLADPFPEPWVTLAATPVWDLRTVRAWGQSVGLSDLVPASA